MSADSVEDCPICTKILYDKMDTINQEIKDAFTMIASEYEKFKRKKEEELDSIEEDISENYQIGIYGNSHVFFNDNDNLCISIGADCERCKTTWEADIKIKPKKVK